MRLKLLFAGLMATTFNLAQAADATYEIIPVERASGALKVSIAGTVTASKTVQLTAQAPGRVIEITNREGDAVEQGQTLLKLDESAMLARREAAYAARESAAAAMQNAYAQMQREYASPRSNAAGTAPGGMGVPAMMDQLFTSPMQGFMGMQDNAAERYSDIVGVQTGFAQARTAMRQAEANIMEIEARLRDMRSVAPFSGVVDRVYVEVGDTVQPGQPLVDFSQSASYKIDADLPVHLVRSLQPGSVLMARLDNNGSDIPARVFRIHPSADLQRHTVRVELTLPPGTKATSGQYAQITVPDTQAAIPSQLSIPQSAIVERGSMQLVYAVDGNGAARLRVVRLGESAGNGKRVVLSGVKEGDLLVNNPPPGLSGGTQVRMAEPAPAATADSAQ